MVSYDEEDEDSDIFGESDRDDDDDNEDNTEVRLLRLTEYLPLQPGVIQTLILLSSFRTPARRLLPRSWQPGSKATPSLKRREIVPVSRRRYR